MRRKASAEELLNSSINVRETAGDKDKLLCRAMRIKDRIIIFFSECKTVKAKHHHYAVNEMQ